MWVQMSADQGVSRVEQMSYNDKTIVYFDLLTFA